MADPQIPLINTSLNPNITVNRSQAEQAIYLQLDGDSRFPAISTVRVYEYPDNTQAFIPSDKKLGSAAAYTAPLTSIQVFPKFSTLNYIVNSEDFIVGQGGFTTITAGGSAYGTFGALQILGTNATFNGLSATSSSIIAITGVSIASTVGIIYGPFTGVACSAGGPVIIYNA